MDEIERAVRQVLADNGGRASVSDLKRATQQRTGCSADDVAVALSRLETDLTDDGLIYLVD
ncbi:MULTISPECIES: hypothetical protein [Mycolicibacterium]|uniref:hypothetical protein n=1 Tax=Mycolicibacterium TaxID=1866885 RepID=UPI0002EA942E|nr:MULTISPECIES: hypothetical protein [Mycolicibacterium]